MSEDLDRNAMIAALLGRKVIPGNGLFSDSHMLGERFGDAFYNTGNYQRGLGGLEDFRQRGHLLNSGLQQLKERELAAQRAAAGMTMGGVNPPLPYIMPYNPKNTPERLMPMPYKFHEDK